MLCLRRRATVKEKVALIIVYNHKYDKNINILEKIYNKRFSNIFHLVPFYEGKKSNVISVYENARYSQGYMAQGLNQYFEETYLHYFFIADDLMLNPVINEKNYREHFNLSPNTSFLPNFIKLHEGSTWWPRVKEAYEYCPNNKEGVEVENELPSYSEAVKIFKKYSLEIKPLSFNQIYRKKKLTLQTLLAPRQAIRFFMWAFVKLKYFLKRKSDFNLRYPIIGSYSDIVIVSEKNIKKFCHYCGVFAAETLFVEVALPTALVLSAEKIVTENDLLISGKALWTSKDYEEIQKYAYHLKNLISDFPENYIYLHPIKLSEWNTEI